MRPLAKVRNVLGAAGLLCGLGLGAASAQTLMLPPSKVLECMTPAAGERGTPEYDAELVQRKEGGSVKVELAFGGPDTRPGVRVLTPDTFGEEKEVDGYFSQFRLPCLENQSPQLDFLFKFRIDGGERTVINDMDLKRFLGSAAKVPTPVRFDTRTMGCPFDLRLGYWQPFRRNLVEQLEAALPERAEFMEWLSHIELKLDKPTARKVLGDTFTLSVPCTQISL